MKTSFVTLSMIREKYVGYDTRVTLPEQAAEIVRSLTRDAADESFFILSLDIKSRIYHIYRAAQGGSASVAVNIKDALRCAVMSDAFSIIIAHNHPSGDAAPSGNDIAITRQFNAACEILGLRLLDSLVVVTEGFNSIK